MRFSSGPISQSVPLGLFSKRRTITLYLTTTVVIGVFVAVVVTPKRDACDNIPNITHDNGAFRATVSRFRVTSEHLDLVVIFGCLLEDWNDLRYTAGSSGGCNAILSRRLLATLDLDLVVNDFRKRKRGSERMNSSILHESWFSWLGYYHKHSWNHGGDVVKTQNFSSLVFLEEGDFVPIVVVVVVAIPIPILLRRRADQTRVGTS